MSLVIHLLTGEDAKKTQQGALEKFREAIDGMSDGPIKFSGSQEDAIHGLGDGIAHVDNSGKMFSSPFGHLWPSLVDMVRGWFGLPPKFDPDNPYTHPDRWQNYLGTMYDELTVSAKGRFTPRMTRDEFVAAGMSAASKIYKEEEQKSNMQSLIKELEAK